MVWRPNDPIGSWQAGSPPHGSTTIGDPYMTDIAGIATLALFNRAWDGRLMYAFNSGDDWWHYSEPVWPTTEPGMGIVAPGIHEGHRQHGIGPPVTNGWDYGPSTSFEGGTIAWWRSGYVVAHREPSTSIVRNRVLASPRYDGPVWGPAVPQPVTTTVAPLLVRTAHKSGLQRALWMVERASDSQIRWRESRGGQ
jgi:hypothetical protein